jgi:hypothetical protein
MVLVDERLLDSNPMMQHFQNKQDRSWKQPTEDSVKSSISKKLKATLHNPNVPHDVKAKRYSHNLDRFLQAKSALVEVEVKRGTYGRRVGGRPSSTYAKNGKN